MKRAAAFMLVFLAAVLPAGCAKPTPQPTPNPDASLLAGRWEEFIPVESLPQSVTLDASGSATVDGVPGAWKISGDTLTIRQGGSETPYSYTVSGYMLTLTGGSAGASDFYINPDQFAGGADKNAQLTGQWAAFSTFSMMNFDGAGGLDSIVYTTAGRTDLPMKYAARDGILQSYDTGGNYTYNLYSFNADGALLLAETTDYDNENKQWTAYWKKADPPAGMLGSWAMAFDTQPGNAGLPTALSLQAGGKGTAAMQGTAAGDIRWEYYSGGFVALALTPTSLQYAWSDAQGGTLSLGNPDVDEAWYLDPSRYKPSAADLIPLVGTWKSDDGKTALEIKAGGAVTATNGEGKKTAMDAAAADGLMRLRLAGKTFYMAYGFEGDTMKLYYGDVPFFDTAEMPVSLTKQ